VSEIEAGVTVMMAEENLELASVALTTWDPVAEVGTVKVAVNEPTEEVATTPVACTIPSNLIVTADDEVKPDPMTVTELPT
jgi:hypothetical protein